MSTPAENLLLIEQLRRAIDELPTHTAPILLEDVEGCQYELLRSRVIGAKTDDPGLVLKIRRTR
jgi:hypothetical protein